MTKNIYLFSCNVPVLLVRFSWNLNFLDRFSENTQISIFTKHRPEGAECSVQTDGRTDMTSLILASRNFAKAPTKNSTFRPHNLLVCLCVSLNKQRFFPNAGLTDLFS